MTERPDLRAYWEDRLQAGPSLETVGWLGLGRGFNTWMYRVRAYLFVARVRRMLRRLGLDPARMRVLDVGSGSGFYVDLWRRIGVRDISGCDLTQASVSLLQRRYPHASFKQADIGDAIVPFEENAFDAVSCMDVLFHIVEDERYDRAMRNCGRLLRAGGLFIFTDNCLHAQERRGVHQVSRTLAQVETAAAAASLTVLERKPVFVLMNTPVDSTNRAHVAFWNALQRVARRPAAGVLLGMLLFLLEMLLASSLREGPSTEMLICRTASS